MNVKFGDTKLPERFWEKVIVRDDCWIWTACFSGRQPMFRYEFKTWSTHRLVYSMYIGQTLTRDMFIDRDCGNKLCVNPAHLTIRRRVLLAKRINGDRTACKKGHPYETKYKARNSRRCIICRRKNAAERWHKSRLKNENAP